MSLRVVVVGIPGVGKTTLVEKIASALKNSKLVTFGTVMFEEGLRLRWIKHRDELRKMPVEKQRRLQRIAARRISNMKDKLIIVDTHLFIRTPEGFWPGLPYDIAKVLKPTHLILVEASSNEIMGRRARDKSRYRDEVTIRDLEDELSLARNFLAALSSLTGAPMLIVKNEEGKADEVASKIASILEAANR